MTAGLKPEEFGARLRTWRAEQALSRLRSSKASARERLSTDTLVGQYMDAPTFAKRSVHEGLQDQIAPVHSDFYCSLRRCP